MLVVVDVRTAKSPQPPWTNQSLRDDSFPSCWISFLMAHSCVDVDVVVVVVLVVVHRLDTRR